MKTKFITGLVLAALLAFAPGCTTTSDGKKVIDPDAAEKLAPILSGTVAGAVVLSYQKNPKVEVIVDALATAVDEFLLTTNLSPAALQAKIASLPVPELKTAEAQLILAPVLAIYSGFADQKVKEGVNANPGLKRLLQAIVDGLKQGKEGIKQMKSAPTAAIESDMDSLRTIATAIEQEMKREIRRQNTRQTALVR